MHMFWFYASFISIITIFTLETLACALDNGNSHPDNGNIHTNSKISSDTSNTRPNNDSRCVNNTKDGNGINNSNNKSKSNKKHYNSTKKRKDGNMRRNNGNRRDGDGYYIPSTNKGQSIGDIDKTPSYRDLLNSLTTEPGFSYRPRTSKPFHNRTTPYRVSLEEDCDYLAYYCLRAYKTGKLCARTLYYYYNTFDNYCLLDYVNCMERYEMWQITHMGECFDIERISDYQHYEYTDDYFLDQIYVIQE